MSDLRNVTVGNGDNAAIRSLNDRFRMKGIGNGSVMITIGIQNQGEVFVSQAAAAIRSHTTFTKDSDPWNEHDFGVVEVASEKVFWKIDYYDTSLTAGSEDPANEAITHRVLTIMLASEY
ncbi:MAG: DUF3768 domain-containing protein [Candidatus Thiodiazotropha sp. (ex Troendleina suluensis)]|nr:DUF3768 domain-containing protein [Candidatus Thiodiazotropha sp. (ex Troendleina suluensis)]